MSYAAVLTAMLNFVNVGSSVCSVAYQLT